MTLVVGSSVVGSCFNRYMVECEYSLPLIECCYLECFNRYMVECECFYL